MYAKAEKQLGHALASRNLGLVYGGTNVGIMGEFANAALEDGGEVIGVVPMIFVDKKIAHTGLSDLRIVDSMHERKGLMAELSDAIIASPRRTWDDRRILRDGNMDATWSTPKTLRSS